MNFASLRTSGRSTLCASALALLSACAGEGASAPEFEQDEDTFEPAEATSSRASRGFGRWLPSAWRRDAGAARPPSSPPASGTGGTPVTPPSTPPSGAGDAGVAAPTCSDRCAKAGGIDWLCKLRFMYGINYAWRNFGSDFGGNAAWNQAGVSNNPQIATDLATFAANGVSVVRWWVFPDFRGDGVRFDAQDNVLGLGGSALADLERALELAEKNNLYLMLTVWSFDNFRPTKQADGIRARGIRPMVVDDAKRASLMERVVRPLARAAGKSRYAKRLIAWDVINEPEWAINGASLYGGDPPFDANPELESVSHAQMERFLADTIKVLREETDALVSVGGAAIKWSHAWSKLDTDFHQFHMYDWVNKYWPYNKSPKDFGLGDRPVLMGEFPLSGLSGVSYANLLESWYGNAYGGALGWAFTDSGGASLEPVKAFAARHACETKY